MASIKSGFIEFVQHSGAPILVLWHSVGIIEPGDGGCVVSTSVGAVKIKESADEVIAAVNAARYEAQP